MPQMEFSQDNKSGSGKPDFPTLSLKKGELARIVCIEKTPHFEFAHTLRKPVILNGHVEMTVIEKRNGDKVQDFKKEFVGQQICLGDVGTLLDKGVDPDNCPVCAEAMKSDIVASPERRFAMHVIRYSCRPGTFEPVDPYSVSVLVWRYGNGVFNKLADFNAEWGNLQMHDLMLGPCTIELFQRYEIQISQTAAWLASDDRKKLTVETYKNNQAKDLAEFCGRKVDRRFMEQDLETVRQAYRLARGDGATAPGGIDLGQQSADLTAGLEGLLSDTPTSDGSGPFDSPAPAAPQPAAAPADEDVLSSLATAAPPAEQPTAPVAAPVAPAAAESPLDALLTDLPTQPAAPAEQSAPAEEVDFQALMGDLG